MILRSLVLGWAILSSLTELDGTTECLMLLTVSLEGCGSWGWRCWYWIRQTRCSSDLRYSMQSKISSLRMSSNQTFLNFSYEKIEKPQDILIFEAGGIWDRRWYHWEMCFCPKSNIDQEWYPPGLKLRSCKCRDCRRNSFCIFLRSHNPILFKQDISIET